MTIFPYFLYGVSVLVAWALIIFLLAFHEYGHLIACRWLKIPVNYVQLGQLRMFSLGFSGLRHDFGLLPFMGAVNFDPRGRTIKDLAIVAASGPAASIFLGVFLLLLEMVVGPNNLMNMTGWASMALAALNLVPLPPMDGFAMLEYGLFRRGILITKQHRQYLFAAGVVFVSITILLA